MAKSKKKNNKYLDWIKPIMTFVLGVVVSGGVAYVTATNTIRSSEVNYDNSASGLTSNNVQGAIEELNTNATNYNDIIARINNVGSSIYPVGAIYISTSNTNPGTFLGGTWVAFGTGKTIVGVDTSNSSFNSVEKTGGSQTKTLATINLPSHTHSIPALSGTAASAGAHTHTLTGYHGHDDDNGYNGGYNIVAQSDTYAGPCSNGYCGSFTPSTSSNGAHTHSVTTNASTTGATGSGAAFSIMDPYITVYMWKRTA